MSLSQRRPPSDRGRVHSGWFAACALAVLTAIGIAHAHLSPADTAAGESRPVADRTPPVPSPATAVTARAEGRTPIWATVKVERADNGRAVANAALLPDVRTDVDVIDLDNAAELGRTDELGVVRLPTDANSRAVIVTADGFAPAAAVVPLGPGEIVVELRPAGTLDVHVLRTDGRPIADCTVMASTRAVRPWASMPRSGVAVGDRGVAVWCARTDGNGWARLQALPTDDAVSLYAFCDGLFPTGIKGTGSQVSASESLAEIVMDELKAMIVKVDSAADVQSTRWIFDQRQFDPSPPVNVWCLEMQKALRERHPDAYAFVRMPVRGEPKVKFAVRMADGSEGSVEWTVQRLSEVEPILLTPTRVPGAGQLRVTVRNAGRTVPDVPLRLVASSDDPGILARSGPAFSVPPGRYKLILEPPVFHDKFNPPEVEVVDQAAVETVVDVPLRPLRVTCTASVPSQALRSPLMLVVRTASGTVSYPNWPADKPLEIWCGREQVRFACSAYGCVPIERSLAPDPDADVAAQHFAFELAGN